jgi:hypothetical protein
MDNWMPLIVTVLVATGITYLVNARRRQRGARAFDERMQLATARVWDRARFWRAVETRIGEPVRPFVRHGIEAYGAGGRLDPALILPGDPRWAEAVELYASMAEQAARDVDLTGHDAARQLWRKLQRRAERTGR